jgi:hypothetical protein
MFMLCSHLRVCACSLLTALLLPAGGFAQNPTTKAPESYVITENNSMAGTANSTVPMKLTITRDGNRLTQETAYTPPQPGAKPQHTMTLVDLSTHTEWNWDLNDPSVPCTVGSYGGEWSDPFSLVSDLTAMSEGQSPKLVGDETVNGIATKVYELAGPGGEKLKYWLEPKYALVVKVVDLHPNAPPQTQLEITRFSPEKPSAPALALASKCPKAGGGGEQKR